MKDRKVWMCIHCRKPTSSITNFIGMPVCSECRMPVVLEGRRKSTAK